MLEKTLLMRQDLFIIAKKRIKKNIYGKASIEDVKELKEEKE